MKKIIINAFLVCAGLLAFTSCSKKSDNCGTELSDTFVGKASKDRGALDGALLNPYKDSNGEEVNKNDLIEYIQGYQLIMGSKMSDKKLEGIEKGIEKAREINKFESMTGYKFNRELYLREFRNFIQKKDLKQSDIDKLYKLNDEDLAVVEEFLKNKLANECTQQGECSEQCSGETMSGCEGVKCGDSCPDNGPQCAMTPDELDDDYEDFYVSSIYSDIYDYDED